ncbi:helix-turn-helix domain-containing protein [Leuconostoc miyukkimchii]|uniref:helix-turn-helix domain-containing protein n=1 Tax=Leuconostoc miyukkimchii TaxID=910540 RepID=UPI001C7D42F9|nr:helix-turn-helix transcriptional regulator [Leuconostoc miyukkimchii]
MVVGDRIYILRKELGLTQKKMADELFISYQLVSKWERHLGEPTTEMILQIIDRYQLPFDYFIESGRDEHVNQEKEMIIRSFIKSMFESPDIMPSLVQVAEFSSLSLKDVKQHFKSVNEITYELFAIVDKKIKLEVSSQVENSKDILQIFIFDMSPMLYERRIILNVLYTRPYIKDAWTHFISNRYKKLLLTHQKVEVETKLDMAYLIEILIAFISVWLKQSNPEPLAAFQNRIIQLIGVDFTKLFGRHNDDTYSF